MKTANAKEAERAVLSSCIASGDSVVYDEIVQIMNDTDFFDYNHSKIFSAIGGVLNNGEELNEITIADQLRTNKCLDDIGGMPALFSIMDAPCTMGMGISSAKIVKKLSRQRQLDRLYRLKLENLSEGEDVVDVASSTETKLREIMADGTESNSLENSARDLKSRLKSMLDGTYKVAKVPTGIQHLDDKLDEGGIGQGEVCVVAAPTSCGKSQLALNIVLRASIVDNIPSMIFSFEMPANQLTKRMTQTSAAVNLKRFADGVPIHPDVVARVDDAIDKIGKAPIYTEHHVRNIDDLRSKARAMKRKHDIKVIVIDYLQLIPFDSKLSKHEGISQASHGIKQMAMELDVAVVLLAQINRTGAMRDSGLVLYDLKDSGDIENDADIAILMWASGGSIDASRRTDPNGTHYLEMDYNVAKNREGERDLMGKFKFINSIGRFN